MTDAERFLLALADRLPDDERMILCGFVGDPDKAPSNAWRPRPWKPGSEIVLNEKANGYVTVSSFRKADDGTFRRRQDCFAAGRALMVDDVRTKVALELVMGVPPSAIIETSPNNEQWWYFMAEPIRDMSKFDGVIAAFISQKMLGAPDPGMAGVNRVARLPGFVNGKAKNKGWVTKLTLFEPERRFWPDQLMTAFGLKYVGFKQFWPTHIPAMPEIRVRLTNWGWNYKWLIDHKMVKKARNYENIEAAFDASGWTEIHCPWVDEHTGGADTGAAVRMPKHENGYYGAFRCHHGHCADKGWGDLTDWMLEQTTETIEAANANATTFEETQR